MEATYSETPMASELSVTATDAVTPSIASLSIQETPVVTSNNVDDGNNSSGMDFFFTQVPSDSEWLRGATELDIRLNPVLQDRIAQSCLIKMQQASSGRESLQRLAQLSSLWRRIQTEMLLMPVFTAPQVPAPLDQWFTEFAASSEASPSLMQGLSADFNWNLDLLVSASSPPSSSGLVGYELGSLWNMMDSQDYASTVGNSFPLPSSSSPSSPTLLSSEHINQTPSDITSTVDGLPSVILQDARMNSIQAGPVVTSIPEPLQTSNSIAALSNESSMDSQTESSVSIDNTQEPSKVENSNSEVTGMDVDLPMQDMTLTSPPPSIPSKSRSGSSSPKKQTTSQRRASIPRKAKRTVRRHTRKPSKETLSFKTRLASEIEENESDEALEHADRNKRRRGSKDSTSSDSGPESAPGSPQTPPSTYDGLNAAAVTSEKTPPQNSESLFVVEFQDTILNSDKSSHMSATVAVEDLVNLKRLEEEETHSPFRRRPSTRAFGQS
ncbi:hypothetical protein BGZ49_004046 [Haplosporangium sp. Z 27]|nr:hypothetical protein BGZ49_004046 [Haplosporangium sp. Z 27]